MKKILLIVGFLISHPTFALTEQVQNAQNFITQKVEQTNQNISEKNTQALALNRELNLGQKSASLKTYQTQHGLEPTGIYDKATVAFVQSEQERLGYNVTKILDSKTWFATYEQPIEWQKIQVQNAIEQWQKVLEKQQANNTPYFIVVNIPSQTLTLYKWEANSAIFVMRSNIVVGKTTTKTPMQDFAIWGIKYHPTWTPTPNMLKRSVYKNGQINTQWLRSHGIQAVNSAGKVVPLDEVSIHSGVRFMQPAGNHNALGILKFETDSPENIYLHDTNEKYLFSHNVRLYSSGCIRVENFKLLAQQLTGLDDMELEKKLANHSTRIEKTTTKTPVYFTYAMVSFIDNQAIFYPDVYRLHQDIIYQP